MPRQRLNWIVGWKKGEFLGSQVLQRQKAEGPPRKLVGFEMLDRAIARHGYDAYADGAKAGIVTNGTQTDARPGQVIANSLLEKR